MLRNLTSAAPIPGAFAGAVHTKNAPLNVAALRAAKLDETYAMLKFMPATAEELKAAREQRNALGDEAGDGFVAGWASTPDLDSYRHVVVTGAFDESISKRGLIGPKGIKLLIGHDWDKVAGTIRTLENRGGRLWIEAQLNLRISYAKDAYEACLMSGGLNFSVGFMLADYEWKKDDDKNEYLQINRGDLFEVSIVPFPGNEECTMDIVKSRATEQAIKSIAAFEKYLLANKHVACRNEAHKLVRLIKSASHLFTKGAEDSDDLDEDLTDDDELATKEAKDKDVAEKAAADLATKEAEEKAAAEALVATAAAEAEEKANTELTLSKASMISAKLAEIKALLVA